MRKDMTKNVPDSFAITQFATVVHNDTDDHDHRHDHDGNDDLQWDAVTSSLSTVGSSADSVLLPRPVVSRVGVVDHQKEGTHSQKHPCGP